jgi:hypothetical protein
MLVEQVHGSGVSQTVSTNADHIACPKGLEEKTPPSDCSPRMRYLTTKEAAAYLRKSESWLLRQGDIPYLSGRPNVYDAADLDAWVERHKHQPLS